MYVFFVAVATIPPGEVAGLTLLVGAVASFILIRQARLNSELANPAGDPALRRACNRQREKRGF